MTIPPALAELHAQIDDCLVCSSFVNPLDKPASGLDRGVGNKIMIVGQAPGKTEVTSRKAFSGGSGTRLDSWLTQSGQPAENPREGVYLTSILKCRLTEPKKFACMAQMCRHFLENQIELIKPRVVITLGSQSFDYLHFAEGSYDELIGRLLLPADFPMLPAQPFGAMLHWPHPSGLNRWPNIVGNAQRLQTSFKDLKDFLSEGHS
jgi:uracil-DNA glycosylase family 4